MKMPLIKQRAILAANETYVPTSAMYNTSCAGTKAPRGARVRAHKKRETRERARDEIVNRARDSR